MNGKLALSTLVWALCAMLCSTSPAAVTSAVQLKEDQITVPTYLLGDPEPNPIFYDGRGSQGAQGRVYPYPLYDSLTNTKSNKVYRIVYLENEYVRIGILPEIGGRLFEAIDKSNGYNFIYRQHVIKPALIGLIGAWISGGVEWNIPHHHRATTALPVQYRTQENEDGSKTIWVGELELRHRMRWAVGYTLRPGRSYLECSVRILNRTPYANTMLCFANVAVHVNDSYQVIYPPRTQFVTFHSKHEFTTWPIATTRYAGADFTKGVDVSWYANHVSANSMFAWNYQDDFFAGYDHGRNAGIMSFADHHIIPGKKFWTWGNGPRGRMWDKILTDEDGPYIELMVGAYSDNQPDYSWLQPYETKSFQMYWYPFRDIGGVKNANLEAGVNLEVTNQVATVGFCTTSEHPSAKVLVQVGTNILVQDTVAIGPSKPYVKSVPLPAGTRDTDLRASLIDDSHELIAYTPVQLEPAKMPEPVRDPGEPKDIKSIEELYLAGQRIEQFHAANPQPELYWEEALRRDPADARVNTAIGIRLLKQARFDEAEKHLRTAIQRLTHNYTAPKDGEAFYYLGLALESRAMVDSCPQTVLDEAVDAFFKATWSQAWRAPAYFALAELASLRGDIAGAMNLVDRSLEANLLNLRAINLKAALLRHAGQAQQALTLLDSAAKTSDPLDTRLCAERWLAGDPKAGDELSKVWREFPATALETATEYGRSGLWQDAIACLERTLSVGHDRSLPPLVYYCLGEFHDQLGQRNQATQYRRLGRQASPEYAFPFEWENIPALRHAFDRDPSDARAPYYLGNLFFEGQPELAAEWWQRSAALDPAFAIVHRNLALGSARGSSPEARAHAIAELEKAVDAPVKYALHFSELDALYAAAGTSPEKRLELLERNHATVAKRDDALSREIGLLVFAGKYDRAIELMTGRRFSVWEGGALDVAQHWVNAHVLRGRLYLERAQFDAALADFEQAKTVPDNLPNDTEGPTRTPEIFYWIGLAYEQMWQGAKAAQAWGTATEASEGKSKTDSRVSARQVQSYFTARVEQKLKHPAQAEAIFKGLLDSAAKALDSQTPPETFRHRGRPAETSALAHYICGLGRLGLGEKDQAQKEFQLALESQPDLVGAKVELAALQHTNFK